MDILVFIAIVVVFIWLVIKMNSTKPKNTYENEDINYKVANQLVKIFRTRLTEGVDKSGLKGKVNIENLSDEQILKIAQEVIIAFKKVAN